MSDKLKFKKLGNECITHLMEINPSGGIATFIRMACEFGYKRAEKDFKAKTKLKR